MSYFIQLALPLHELPSQQRPFLFGVEDGHSDERARGIPGMEFFLVDGGVDVADEVEDGSERLCRIQVVFEAMVEIVFGLLDARGHFRTLARRELFVLQTIDEVAQALDGTRSLLEAVESEIKLTAIGHGREQKADR